MEVSSRLVKSIQYWAGACCIRMWSKTPTAGQISRFADVRIERLTGNGAAWVQRTCASGNSCSCNGPLPPKQPIRAEPLRDQ